MRKELRERMEKAFAALNAEVVKNPAIAREAITLVADLNKNFRNDAVVVAKAAVAQRKEDRIAKRAEKQQAIADAKAAKEEAKAKFAAALAMKVNGKIAKKRTEKPVEAVPAVEAAEVPAEAPELF